VAVGEEVDRAIATRRRTLGLDLVAQDIAARRGRSRRGFLLDGLGVAGGVVGVVEVVGDASTDLLFKNPDAIGVVGVDDVVRIVEDVLPIDLVVDRVDANEPVTPIPDVTLRGAAGGLG
jgi:hypothetical protein